ncbi:hypothetical protein TREMEDRAFT_60956 [Tremella mesenterica DSM 1558]|uniref:uncharacterized protein n=1 Tax=Tremella mesenterica (strain ATCC 24925 / CBS 8224 / DSM 1558 / NBRC 9311 / NRRL Y-6157 / RJB 2259-6 / UBC 559-6) TaxID=578456 RepID=UPI0003F49966|nr:uncharacterized protein TREMEDRAFT_60956 [Tremella mesenterica DSM 1558]EIW70452.1 hypothetical protein TREMEDRAFT_60956 [Tremella mesenterica DSM 1558]
MHREIIIDLTMFEPSSETTGQLRSCWVESALLVKLISTLPSLEHLCLFADASDDSTLSLLFSSLIAHPSLHPIPPPVVPPSPSVQSMRSCDANPTPLNHRLRSFGWRQRGEPPQGFRDFSHTSAYVSTLHLLRHCHQISFVVLDADLTEAHASDILVAVKELALREHPPGEEGPKDIKELFIDRPLVKSRKPHSTTFEQLTALLQPLAGLPHLQLLQVGSYALDPTLQTRLALHLSLQLCNLLVIGLLQGDQGQTVWWGIWRHASKRSTPEGSYFPDCDIVLAVLGDGHLKLLEEGSLDWKFQGGKAEDAVMTTDLEIGTS